MQRKTPPAILFLFTFFKIDSTMYSYHITKSFFVLEPPFFPQNKIKLGKNSSAKYYTPLTFTALTLMESFTLNVITTSYQNIYVS